MTDPALNVAHEETIRQNERANRAEALLSQAVVILREVEARYVLVESATEGEGEGEDIQNQDVLALIQSLVKRVQDDSNSGLLSEQWTL